MPVSSETALEGDAELIVKLCNASQLPAPGEMKAFTGGNNLQICVAQVDGSLAAFDNRCPHQNGPLSSGHLEGCKVVCPYHGWKFDVRTGEGALPDDPLLHLYEIRVHQDEVFVRLPKAVLQATPEL